MTAARHASPPAASRPLLAVAVVLAVAAAWWGTRGLPANTAVAWPAVRWVTWNTPWFTERWAVPRRQP